MGVGLLAYLIPCSWAQAPAALEAGDAITDPAQSTPALTAPVLKVAPALEPLEEVPEGGAVRLLLLIDEAGHVEEASALEGDPRLYAAALASVNALEFEPAREGQEPVAVEMEWVVALPPMPPTAPATPPATSPTTPPATPPAVSQEAPPTAPDDGLVGTFFRPGSPPRQRTLSQEQIATLPGTMGDPVRAAANLPGVMRTPLEAGWLLVRGGAPEDTGLFVDGLRVPMIYHLGGLTSVVHPAFVGELAFLPSGQPSRYGDATAGVLDLRTAKTEPGLRASASVDLVSSGAFVTGSLGEERPLGLQAAVRRSYLDAALNLVPGISEEQASIAPRFWDWGARATLGRGSLFAFGYDDQIEVPNDEAGSTVNLSQGTSRVQGAWSLPLAERSLELSGVFAREWAEILADELTDQRLAIRSGGRVELPDPGTASWGWSLGLEGQAGTWEMAVNDVNVGGPIGSVNPYGALRLGRQSSLTLGLRLDTLLLSEQLARAAPSSALVGRVALGQDGRGGQWVGTADLGLYHGWPPLDVTFGLPGGAYLPLSRAWGGGLGLSRAGERVQADLDLWARALDRITVLEDDNSLGQGRGLAAGAEALVEARLGPLQSRTCLTLSRSLRQDEPGHPWEPYLFDQPIVLQNVLAWAINEPWTLAARFRYTSGYPRDPDIDSAYDILLGETRELDANADRLPPYHALDLKITRRIPARRWALEGYLDIQNLYNRRVPEPAITGVTWQPIFYTYGLPVLPIFGLSGTFRSL